jgi:hypothetical protein
MIPAFLPFSAIYARILAAANTPPSANNPYIIVCFQKGNGFVDPAGDKLAVTINKLNVTEICCRLTQTLIAHVSCPRGGKRSLQVQHYNVAARTSRPWYRILD